MDKLLLTPKQLSQEFQVSYYMVMGLIKEGKIKCIKSGNRHYVNRHLFANYINGGEQ